MGLFFGTIKNVDVQIHLTTPGFPVQVYTCIPTADQRILRQQISRTTVLLRPPMAHPPILYIHKYLIDCRTVILHLSELSEI